MSDVTIITDVGQYRVFLDSMVKRLTETAHCINMVLSELGSESFECENEKLYIRIDYK